MAYSSVPSDQLALKLVTLRASESLTGLWNNVGLALFRGLALPAEQQVLTDLESITTRSPFRHWTTPRGFRMSVAMTNCGTLGWISDRTGYRYSPLDPDQQTLWPSMPASFLQLAQTAAQKAGFSAFTPDACLINRYESGARMTLHQDKDEQDFAAPIVSVSLGCPATFLFGGATRSAKAERILLTHGDVVVWGGASRLHYHGVLPLKVGQHSRLGSQRINLTFRKAGLRYLIQATPRARSD